MFFNDIIIRRAIFYLYFFILVFRFSLFLSLFDIFFSLFFFIFIWNDNNIILLSFLFLLWLILYYFNRLVATFWRLHRDISFFLLWHTTRNLTLFIPFFKSRFFNFLRIFLLDDSLFNLNRNFFSHITLSLISSISQLRSLFSRTTLSTFFIVMLNILMEMRFKALLIYRPIS